MPDVKAYFLRYQIKWLKDKSRIKLWEKSRRIGATFVQSYEDVEDCVFDRLKNKRVWFSSADESAAKEYIDYCAMWAKLYDMGARELGEVVIDKERDIKALTIEFANGYKIHALSSSPKGFRSKGGKVVLDEFAHHKDQRAMWKAAKPSAMWGDPIRILSTHSGKKLFYGFIDAIKKGKLNWSLHTVDIFTAVQQGLVSKILGHRTTKEEEKEWLENERRDAFDEITWLEEYGCQAQDEGSAFIEYETIAKCESSDVLWDQEIIPYPWNGKKILEPNNPQSFWVHDKVLAFRLWLQQLEISGQLFLGLDVGRRKDLSVIWLIEKINNVYFTRSVLILEQMKFWVQEEVLYSICRHRKFVRGCIDETGIGMQLAERAIEKFGSRIEAVNFASGNVKNDMAYNTKNQMENVNVFVPAEEDIRSDIHSIQKVVTSANNIRFAVDKSEDVSGHADRFWALALALHAAQEEFIPIHIESRKKRESAKLLRNFDTLTNVY